jgi:predicted PurR-regulated permease PerM
MKASFSRDVPRITLTVLLIFALITSVFWIIRPFIPSLIWATMIVVATWPLMLRLQKSLRGKRGLATLAMTAALLLVFVIPFWLAVVTIVDNSTNIQGFTETMRKSSLPMPPSWLDKIPVVGTKIVEYWHKTSSGGIEELNSQFKPYTGKLIKWFVDQAGSFGKIFIQFLLTVIISAILYMKGDDAAKNILSFSRRLGGGKGEEAVMLAAKSIRGIALGVVVTALVQSLLGGIGLAATGIPAATLLTAVMFMLCIAQVGPGLVLIPAIIWLFWGGHSISGTILIVWTIIVVSIDNVLRPILIKKGADLSLLLVFAGVIGGLMAFGIVGIFVGPVVLAVASALFRTWLDEEDAQLNSALDKSPVSSDKQS